MRAIAVGSSRILEKVVVASFTTSLPYVVVEAGNAAAYSRSKRKVSKTSRTTSMVKVGGYSRDTTEFTCTQ